MLLAKIYHTFICEIYCIFQKEWLPKKDCKNYFHFYLLGKTCRKTWTFTRVPQLEFVGEANEEITNVNDIGKQNASKKEGQLTS